MIAVQAPTGAMFVFQCIKGNTIGKYPAFLGLFVWIEKDRESCQMQRMRSSPENCDCTIKWKCTDFYETAR